MSSRGVELYIVIIDSKLDMKYTIEIFKKENSKQKQVLEFLEKLGK
ncbi:MAG: hypothetical protein QG565_738 [Campylobacterota bacterium]|nr:hypothetical protein [Campylobacterota bacterium]MDQ1268613.1 hypothetical protein [Campylobacterota bacterium]MDQ1337229.1 hypothetical protein [Campylobacterota bacterium]